MPKLVLFLLAVLCTGVAISACGGGSSNPATPTPVPSFSASPNPKITSETIHVTVLGTPAANIPVAESTPKSMNSPRPGTTIITKNTGKGGNAKFTGLKPSATYCWVATISKGRTVSTCAPWPVWQYTNPITLST